MKSDHVLIIIYVLMGIAAIIYFMRRVSVDPATDQEYPNASVVIHGNQLIIWINKHEVSLAYNNAKGHLRQYYANCHPCGFEFLWTLHEASE